MSVQPNVSDHQYHVPKGYKVAILGLVALSVILGGLLWSVMQANALNVANTSNLNRNGLVQVSGHAKSTGANTGATQIIFNGLQGACLPLNNGANSCGAQFSVAVGYPESPGTQGLYGGTLFDAYTAYLPNHTTYSVKIVYAGVFNWQGGALDVGQFTVDTSGSQISKDFTANTPDSWVGVSGVVRVIGSPSVPAPNPLNVSFFPANLGGFYSGQRPASDRGGRFMAQVLSDNSYSLNLPNYANFAAAIDWASSNGTHGTCYGNPFAFATDLYLAVNVGNGGAYYTYNPVCGVQ